MVGSKEKDAKNGHGDTPQLVNKLDKNASFSNGTAANGNGQKRRGSASSSSSSSSSSKGSSTHGEEQAVKLLEPEAEPNVVTTSSMQSSSQVTSKSETVTSEDGTHTTTINQEHSQTHVTSATQQVITSTQVITDPKEVEALLAAGGEYTSTHQESSRVCLESSQVTSETRVISGQELEDRMKDIQAGSTGQEAKNGSSSSSSSSDDEKDKPEDEDTLISETTTTEMVGPDTYRTESVEVKTTPESHTEIVKTVIVTQEHSESHDVGAHDRDDNEDEEDIPPPPPPPPAPEPETETIVPKKADLAALGVVEMKGGSSSSSSSSSSDEEEIPPPPEVDPPQGEQYAQLVTPSGFSPSHEFTPVVHEDDHQEADLPAPPPESEVTIPVVDIDEAEAEANAEDGHDNDKKSKSSSSSSSSDSE